MDRITLAIAALCMIFISSCSNAQNDDSLKTELSPVEFSAGLDTTQGALLVDVRTHGEFASGHLPDAQNIDWNSANFEKEIAQLDREKTVYVYCQSGRRSDAAADKMRDMGFKNVLELDGGIAAWSEAGMPVANE